MRRFERKKRSVRARRLSDSECMNASAGHDPKWAAVVGRDRRADGTFYYSVKTTGVYCRPSCPSRRANPKNVRFHATAADAERAGFRPCRRCKPDQPPLEQIHAAKVAEICRLIETEENAPSLATLAARAHMSPYLPAPCIQGRDRGDASRLCGSPSDGTRPSGARKGKEQDRDRSYLPGRIQFGRPVLRNI